MFFVLLSVLALAGAPASTHVECSFVPPAGAPYSLGETFATTVTMVDGKPVLGALNYIELGQIPCGALLYASASPSERTAIRRLNPTVDFDQLLGVGLQVALHEATHVALNSTNECLVEKQARTEIDGLIERVADPGRATAEEAAATASDASLPAAYHGC